MAASVATQSQADFYKGFLMARQKFEPSDYGIDKERSVVISEMLEDFSEYTCDLLTVDELLLRPRSALDFCNEVRRKRRYFDLPDDVILRVIMNRRKNPPVQ